MATEQSQDDDLLRLNALVDGELPPAEHAALATRIAAGRDLAHAHATLARLKACISEAADTATAPALPLRRDRSWAPAAGIAAAVVAGFAGFMLLKAPEILDEPARTPEAAIVLAALPAVPVLPSLGAAGLDMVATEVETVAGTRVLVAVYRGSRGCRLELRVHPAWADVPPTAGTRRKAWTVGDLSYELAAFGMPGARFAVVAAAAEKATRAMQPPDGAERRLREARLGAPPCVS
jgi:hypothetical protein